MGPPRRIPAPMDWSGLDLMRLTVAIQGPNEKASITSAAVATVQE